MNCKEFIEKSPITVEYEKLKCQLVDVDRFYRLNFSQLKNLSIKVSDAKLNVPYIIMEGMSIFDKELKHCGQYFTRLSYIEIISKRDDGNLDAMLAGGTFRVTQDASFGGHSSNWSANNGVVEVGVLLETRFEERLILVSDMIDFATKLFAMIN
jgi:hypothetical protein